MVTVPAADPVFALLEVPLGGESGTLTRFQPGRVFREFIVPLRPAPGGKFK